MPQGYHSLHWHPSCDMTQVIVNMTDDLWVASGVLQDVSVACIISIIERSCLCSLSKDAVFLSVRLVE